MGKFSNTTTGTTTGTTTWCERASYELRFCPLSGEEHLYAFPCDAAGHVDMDSLSARALANYMYARAVVGRLFGAPTVQASAVG